MAERGAPIASALVGVGDLLDSYRCRANVPFFYHNECKGKKKKTTCQSLFFFFFSHGPMERAVIRVLVGILTSSLDLITAANNDPLEMLDRQGSFHSHEILFLLVRLLGCLDR